MNDALDVRGGESAGGLLAERDHLGGREDVVAEI
jgi:hypothetical protein